ncbi:MAG: RDD family protein [Phycisphaerae bacterium]|nr:MAG: hypothetical protein EDS66_05515 [Planctomycetota bacterium]KAB2944383.1 MAG: RDD family protein [Phycisphaerae bacterium]MBE7457247.1 RDD family protein [Planctomycetia bacterium]MCK6465463.1 RDD family protein [Phycisphaerae bacterium]MCL4719144.1 RDD family protein [Phycisphaerae bacterium]
MPGPEGGAFAAAGSVENLRKVGYSLTPDDPQEKVMNPGSPPIDADATPPAPPCPLCGQVRKHSKWVKFYTGYVCASCSERFIERRWMAYLIDMIALGVFWTAVGLILRAWTGALMASDLTELVLSPCVVAATPCWPLPLMNVTAQPGAPGSLNLLIPFFFLLSLLCKDGFRGQSPGKAAFGLRVVYCRDLTPISFGASLKRNLNHYSRMWSAIRAAGFSSRERSFRGAPRSRE